MLIGFQHGKKKSMIVVRKFNSPRGEVLTLDEFRSLIYVSRYKKKMENVCNGWGIINSELEDLTEGLSMRLKAVLGEHLFQAKFHGKTLSLSEVVRLQYFKSS